MNPTLLSKRNQTQKGNTLSLHLYNVRKQAKLSYALRSHNIDYPRGRGGDKKGMECFWVAGNVLVL